PVDGAGAEQLVSDYRSQSSDIREEHLRRESRRLPESNTSHLPFGPTSVASDAARCHEALTSITSNTLELGTLNPFRRGPYTDDGTRADHDGLRAHRVKSDENAGAGPRRQGSLAFGAGDHRRLPANARWRRYHVVDRALRDDAGRRVRAAPEPRRGARG